MASSNTETGSMVAFKIQKTPKVCAALQGKNISKVISIPSASINAFLCLDDSKISICENNNINGKLRRVFDEHSGPGTPKRELMSMIHLTEDLLCSMDSGGNLITWSASSGTILESVVISNVEAWSLLKLNSTQLAVVSKLNHIYILEHTNGLRMKLRGDLHKKNSRYITAIGVFKEVLIALGDNDKAQVWNTTTRKMVGRFDVLKHADLIRISSKFIVCCIRTEGVLVVYKHDSKYSFFVSINLKDHILEKQHIWMYVHDMTFINPNLLKVTTWTGIFLLSLPSANIVAFFEFDGEQIIGSSTIDTDGSIFAVGTKGNYAVFEMPPIVRQTMKIYADLLYSEVAEPSELVMERIASDLESSRNRKSIASSSGSRKRPREDSEENNELEQVAPMRKELRAERNRLNTVSKKVVVQQESLEEIQGKVARLEAELQDHIVVTDDLESQIQSLREIVESRPGKKLKTEQK